MAGNITSAIATTKAMTASLCVLQAFKILRAQLSKAKSPA
jgi:ubiquitin-like 1-activating enzyme E1 B